MSVLETLRSWRYAKAQSAAAARRAQFGNAVRPVLTTGACLVAMLLLVVPLLTLIANPRKGQSMSKDSLIDNHLGIPSIQIGRNSL